MSTELPTTDEFRFHCDLPVRFRDLDAMGHVNNAVYFTYFETARVGYMRELGHCASDESDATAMFPFILLDASCRFLAPVPLGTTVRVYLRTTRVGTKSFTFEYLVTHGDRPVAVGHSTQVYYDYRQSRTEPLPDFFLALLQRREGKELR